MEKPQSDNEGSLQPGAYAGLTGYPQKIKFELNNPVSVTFKADYKAPLEMPSADDKSVYYIFECLNGFGDNACIQTSAITLLNSLKSLEPLAGKSLVITKKSVGGKTFYYVNRAGEYGTPHPDQEELTGINEDGTM